MAEIKRSAFVEFCKVVNLALPSTHGAVSPLNPSQKHQEELLGILWPFPWSDDRALTQMCNEVPLEERLPGQLLGRGLAPV